MLRGQDDGFDQVQFGSKIVGGLSLPFSSLVLVSGLLLVACGMFLLARFQYAAKRPEEDVVVGCEG